MATSKVTFTLDEPTLRRLQNTAERLGKSKSEVVREAVLDYSERIDRLSERERLHMLKVLDEMLPRVLGRRSTSEVDRELKEIGRARRTGGRRTRVEDR